MFYFVGNHLNEQITGVESAQFKRLHLFEQFGEPACFVSFSDSMDRAAIAQQFGLTTHNYVNLYDFLCDIPGNYQVRTTIDTLDLAHNYQAIATTATTRRYAESGRVVAIAHFDAASRQLEKVNYYDANRRCRISEIYDTRGFVGEMQVYDQHLSLTERLFLNVKGECRLRFFYISDPRHQTSQIQVYEQSGRLIQLAGEQDLRRYFFDQLNQSTPRNIFVCDRTLQNAWALENMRTNAFKAFQLHSVQASHLLEDPGSTNWNYNYRQPIENLQQWQVGLGLTDEQMVDLARNLPKAKLLKVPAVVVPDAQLNAQHVSKKQRIPGKIIAVARIDRVKRLEELIQIVKLMHDKRADVSLDIWGMVQNEDYLKELKDLVRGLGLEGVVKMRGFSQDISSNYDQAELMILTSRVEGTVLALAEAQSHGIPLVSYDFKYGPREFIQQGVSGEIVPVDARQEAAAAGLRLLNEPERWQSFSEAAYAGSKRYSANKVFKYWKKLKKRAEHFYG